MNQILDYSQNTNKAPSYKGNSGGGYNPGPQRHNSGGSSDATIVRFFAIILIIFAIVMLGIGAYTKLQNDEVVEKQETQKQQEKAVIELIPDEENSNLHIKITHTKNIERVIYMWNNDREKTLKSQGGSTFEDNVNLPIGENSFTIKVIDAEGNETIEEKVFTSSTGVDITSPQLSLVPEGNKLIITAVDERELDKITYKWSADEEFTEIAVEEEGQKELVHEVEIQRGKNDIIVTAVDKVGNVSTDKRTYQGVTLPEVTIIVSPDGKLATVRVTHEVGIQSINIVLNGESFDVSDLEDGTQTDVSVEFEIDSAIENVIKVTAVSVEGTENKKEETIIYEGNSAPQIEVTQNGNGVHAVFKAEAGILKAELFMLEQNYSIGGLEENPTEAFVDFEIPEGRTRIILTMTDINGEEAVYDQELEF